MVIIWKWIAQKRVHTFSEFWNHFWHYSKKPLDWKNLGFMGATDLLFKLTPAWGLMMLAAIPWVRRKFWEWFLYLHQIVIVILFILFYYHSRYFINTAVLPLSLYVLDKLVRWISIYSRCCKITTIHAYDDVVHLEITVNSIISRWCQFPSLVLSLIHI